MRPNWPTCFFIHPWYNIATKTGQFRLYSCPNRWPVDGQTWLDLPGKYPKRPISSRISQILQKFNMLNHLFKVDQPIQTWENGFDSSNENCSKSALIRLAASNPKSPNPMNNQRTLNKARQKLNKACWKNKQNKKIPVPLHPPHDLKPTLKQPSFAFGK